MLYGYMAYFSEPKAFLAAARRLREEGFRFEAYAPNPVEGLKEALGDGKEPVPWVAFLLGILGLGLALFLQVYASLDYPLNAGGKPVLGWPAFIPVAFELTILTITLGVFLYLLYVTGLPLAWHPVKHAPNYVEVLLDRYGLFVPVTEARLEEAASLLRALGAEVEEVRRA
ncbi:DUF3341 domain-containing protein [Thermus filiformis]|uniref:Membrane protein n=1 Tax=Thermus filiformis TaxID=276 RepID=A0A0A2WRX4_THEFI|nr:DUF3341 domain-containing protein [Thermus filiformis]KGQ22921.1 membrane protein [Thermus filiformis]